VDGSVFAGIQKAVAADRYAFFTGFFQNFYNTDVFLGKRVSEQVVQASWDIAATSSATASFACVPTRHEDFRQDLARIDVPTLVIQGDADRILPIHGHRSSHCQAHHGGEPGCREGGSALHHVDARGRCKRGVAELPGREDRQCAEGNCAGSRCLLIGTHNAQEVH
jgi:pimeloyl-ACP methyl ester carboxylesterase